MEPAFLTGHPGLQNLAAALASPRAAIVTTNGDWLLRAAKPLLPQARLGKFRAPSAHVPDPLKCNLEPGGAAMMGGGVWH
eukprot:SM000042S15353  [mRNA]  locus=s42:495786:496284:- [translate_table: standard]